MKLSAQEKENLCTLANAVLRGAEEGLLEEMMAERYSALRGGCQAYGSDCLGICDLYDRDEFRVTGAALILLLNYGPTYRGPIPTDLPEGSSVVHRKYGTGVVTINKTIKSNSSAHSCWGNGDDIRAIWIDFDGSVMPMKPAEEYLTIVSLADQETA